MNILVCITVVFAIITVGFIVRIFELTSKLTDKKFEMVDKKANNINAYLMLIFLILSFVGLYLVSDAYVPRSLYAIQPVTEHGEKLDWLFNITLVACGFVFIISNIVLFYFAFRYKHHKDRKAYYFVESHKLELIWTVIPTIVMTYLIINGGIVWKDVLMTQAPEDSFVIEVTGKQFAWIIRYPGKDGKFGKTIPKIRTPENPLGLDLSDPNAQDDIIVPGAAGFYMPVNQPVLLKINALDVLHAPYLPHFRVKMDAIPGMTTQFWFVPNMTTNAIRAKIGDEDFNYEMACAELCGKSHFAMKSVVFVDEIKAVNEWLETRKPFAVKFKEKQMALQQ
ncbi:cytochrome c oxidase subunit II [Bacteroidales bacterium AH-315-N07]|nr:cytochrome c oxidase subunit II [Bacteroidales bacterium AH-315-N07]